MKKQMLLSSLMATSLVSPGTRGWAEAPIEGSGQPTDVVGTPSDGAGGPNDDVVAMAIRARLASATVYEAQNSEVAGEWTSSSVLLLKPGGPGQALYNISMGTEDLEMIIRVTDKKGGLDEYGNGNSDDVYFYLKFLTSNNDGKNKSYIGFTCNSSRSCQTGETFFVNIDEEDLTITHGVYGISESTYLPSSIVGVNLKLKKS